MLKILASTTAAPTPTSKGVAIVFTNNIYTTVCKLVGKHFLTTVRGGPCFSFALCDPPLSPPYHRC